jgi:hypothetical protein
LSGRVLIFRDICGGDLELLESILNPESLEDGTKIFINFESIIALLNIVNKQGIDFVNIPRRILFKIFSSVREHILCNYSPKVEWLKVCYGIQNGSFYNVSAMEAVPMSKFIVMFQIHQEAVASINKEQT